LAFVINVIVSILGGKKAEVWVYGERQRRVVDERDGMHTRQKGTYVENYMRWPRATGA